MRGEWVMTRLSSLLSGEIRVDDADKRLEVKDGGTSQGIHFIFS